LSDSARPSAMPVSPACATASPKYAMRRQTTKQPSGAATSARPRPANSARSKNGSATSITPVRTSARRHDRVRIAGEIVPMIVLMLIEAQGARGLGPKQARIFRVLGDRPRHARAADVAIEADDAIALRHDDVQVVRNQQHAEVADRSDVSDQG